MRKKTKKSLLNALFDVRVPVAVLMALGVGGLSIPATAQAVKKDLEIVSRTISFLKSVTTPTVIMAIIEDPTNPASVSNADAVVAFFTSNSKAGKKKLSVLKVSASDQDQLANVDVIFIPKGLEAVHADIGQQAKLLQKLAISTDDSCARNGHCAVSAKSTPRVEILVNQATTNESGVKFSPAFLMLVKKL